MTGATHIESAVAICRHCREAYMPSETQLRRKDFICKPCRAAHDRDCRERRKRLGLRVSGRNLGREYHRQYDAHYSARPEVRERRREIARLRRADPVERMKGEVRRLTRNAINRGELVRQPCEVCGCAKVDAHHDDYSKPLDVRWLCRLHHNEHHAKAREGGAS